MSLAGSSVGKNSGPFQSSFPDRETLWQQTYLEAFQKNYESVQRWTRWKEDHERVKSTLASLPDKISHEVVVPFGSKALMKAKLVHTNEVLTCIGSSWFVKQSAKQGIEMCDRRISQSEEMISRLEKERTLLSDRQNLPRIEEAFPFEDSKEIVEEYNEEAEAAWRRHHREKEAEYHRKLSELRKKQVDQPPLQSEEDIFQRLDELELEEELNDELERLHAEYEADCENNDEDEGESSENESSADDCEDVKIVIPEFDSDDKKKNRRISFADEAITVPCESKDEVKLEEHTYIKFYHSKLSEKQAPSEQLALITAAVEGDSSVYLTPADIYNTYKQKLKTSPPKSILKKSSSYPEKLQDCESKTSMQSSASFGSSLGLTFADSESDDGVSQPVRDISLLPSVLNDVQEKEAVSTVPVAQSTAQKATERPISRFKLARQGGKKQ